MNRFQLFLLLLGLPSIGFSQITLDAEVQARLDACQIDLILPVESDYKAIRAEANSFFPADLELRSRKEKMEIRYRFLPDTSLGTASSYPHLNANAQAIHLASNEPNAIISGHSFSIEELTEQFNADWAMLYTFPPKNGFSGRTTCRLLALYREGVGMAYVAFLFDQPPLSLDARLYALRFSSALPVLR